MKDVKPIKLFIWEGATTSGSETCTLGYEGDHRQNITDRVAEFVCAATRPELFSDIKPIRKSYIRLLSNVRDELHKDGYEQKYIADRLGKNKGLISRWMGGGTNMTLQSLHDMAFAMGKTVEITLKDNLPE